MAEGVEVIALARLFQIPDGEFVCKTAEIHGDARPDGRTAAALVRLHDAEAARDRLHAVVALGREGDVGPRALGADFHFIVNEESVRAVCVRHGGKTRNREAARIHAGRGRDRGDVQGVLRREAHVARRRIESYALIETHQIVGRHGVVDDRRPDGLRLVAVRKREAEEVVEVASHRDVAVLRFGVDLHLRTPERGAAVDRDGVGGRLRDIAHRRRDGNRVLGLRVVRDASRRDVGVRVADRIDDVEDVVAEFKPGRRDARHRSRNAEGGGQEVGEGAHGVDELPEVL